MFYQHRIRDSLPLKLRIIVVLVADDDDTANLQLPLARPRELFIRPEEKVGEQLVAVDAAIRALLPRIAARSQSGRARHAGCDTVPVALGVPPTKTDSARLFLEGADPACGDALGIPRFPASAGAKRAVREGEKAEVGKGDAERSEDES